MRGPEGISEVTSELFILLAVIALAIIVWAMIFGVFRPVDKTAYLVPQFNSTAVSGKTVITVFDRGGDPVYFNNSPKATYKAELYVDTQWGAYKAIPVPSLTLFQPGDEIYVYNTGTGFAMSSNLSGTTFNSLPAGTLSVRLIDATSSVLIAKQDLVTVPVTTTTTTTTTTATTKTTTTVTSPTATTPTPLPSLVANFDFTVGKNGKLVDFTDTSLGSPTSWSWDFGDNTKDKANRNPNHNYGGAGTWTVTLTVTRSSDSATSTITKTVTTT